MSNKRKWLKKPLAVALSFVFLLGSFSAMPAIVPGSVPDVSAVESTGTEIPGGSTAIYTIDDLYSIRANSSGNYILMNDIDLSATAPGGDWDCGTGWSPIPEFKGTLNGNNHIIKNLHIYGNTNCTGFIKKLYGTVHNLKFTNVDVDITGAGVFGTICSYICCEKYSTAYGSSFRAGKVSKCGVDGTIHVEGSSSYIGGLVGKLQNPNGPIELCSYSPGGIYKSYNAADIESVSVDCCVGGIVGYEGYNYTWGSSQNIGGGSTTYYNYCGVIENCYNSGNIVGQSNNAGGIVGNQNGDIINCICFTDGAIYGSKGRGCNANARPQPTTDNCYCRNNCTFGQGGTELTPFFMKKFASYQNFDFSSVWEMAPDRSRPQLRHPREITAVSMEISQMPSKTVYHVGDEFEASGQLTVQCSNGNTAVVDITEDMLSGYDMDTVGTQTVTVSYYGLTTSYEIIVKDIEPTGITLNESDITLDVGDSYTGLSATVYPSNVPDKTVTWQSSNEQVATVENGTITAIAAGTAIITAKTVNNKTASCTVKVIIPVRGIGLNKTSTTITKGNSETLTATITPSDATNKTVTWTTSNSSVATLSNGKVTAVAAGTATITAKSNNGKTATCTVTVKNPTVAVTGISLNKTSASITKGNSLTLTATITPSDATNKTVIWTTSNSSVATVSNGKVTAVAAGTATITAKSNNGKTATCIVTVKSVSTAFEWGKDNWNYENSSYYFPGETYREQINSTYLNKLKSNLTNSEYQAIFIGNLFYSSWLDDIWGGSCYGMSSTTLLAKNGLLPYSSYKSGAAKLNELSSPKNNTNVSSLVTYYQMLQVKDIIQNQYRTVPYKSNETNIKKLIGLLDSNSTVLVGFKKSGWGGHAILAYGYEYGSYSFNGVTYQGCIKICDPNFSMAYDKTANIYFNTSTYNWAIPAYSYAGISSVKGATFNYIGADVNEINKGGYLSGTSSNNTGIDNFVARIDAKEISNNRSVSKVEYSNGNYMNRSSGPSEIIEDYSYVLSGESEGTIGYNLFDPDSAYRVSQDNSERIDLKMDYEKCDLSGFSAAGKSVVFDKNGFVSVEGESADYRMSMVFDDDHPTDWFAVQVSGSNANNATLSKTNEGYVLSADNLQDVEISVNNKVSSANLKFNTQYNSVLIYGTRPINPRSIPKKKRSETDLSE